MDPHSRLPRDEDLPWPAGGGLDRAYRAQIRELLARGRSLVQAELEAFACVAPGIAPEHKRPLSEAWAPPGHDEIIPPPASTR